MKSHIVQIQVSWELLREIFETGWEGDGIRCVTGLPPETKLVRVFTPPGSSSVITIVVEHPSFGPVCTTCEKIPLLTPMFRAKVNHETSSGIFE